MVELVFLLSDQFNSASSSPCTYLASKVGQVFQMRSQDIFRVIFSDMITESGKEKDRVFSVDTTLIAHQLFFVGY
jgi:hypothetical protein